MRKSEILLVATILFLSPLFGFAQDSVQNEILITVTVPEAPQPPPPTRRGGVIPSFPAKVIFEGRAYPEALLTILKNGAVAATFTAQESGIFKKELSGLNGGLYTFGIFAEDSQRRKSVTLNFTIDILEGATTTISRIFIPPTISLEPTQVEKGKNIEISGEVFPKSKVNVFISVSATKEIIREIMADHKGNWTLILNTDFLASGEHTVRAKAFFGEGEQSSFSQTISFWVIAPEVAVCRGADLNFDGRVDIIDFSILLYFWDQRKPTNRCVDINSDGIVDIVDFSIMMYWWNP